MRLRPHFPGTASSSSALFLPHAHRARRQLIQQIITKNRLLSSTAPQGNQQKEKSEISIGVIGGGISGLSTAYHILTKWDALKQLPPVNVTLYEQSDRLGGWMQSKKVPAGNDGEYIRIEGGPRTLSTSPISRVTLEMIDKVGISDSIRWVHQGESGARNRYIYLGDDDLYRFPTDLRELFADYFSPDSKMRPAIHSALSSWITNIPRWLSRSDPSAARLTLAQQLDAHFGYEFTARFLSAFVHGIYAGDIRELSALARGPWQKAIAYLPVGTSKQPDLDHQPSLEQPNRRHLLPWFPFVHDSYMQNLEQIRFPDVKKSFVFYLQEGLGMLSLAVESYLRMNYSSRLSIYMNADVQRVTMDENKSVSVIGQTEGEDIFSNKHDYVVSTVPPQAAMQILEPSPPWDDAQSVSVGCVTLFWRNQTPVKYDGFGYIISGVCPMDKNPHGALGVIFDSSSRPDQDTSPGQKVTVLLGGPFWEPGLKKGIPYPTPEELIQQARETLKIQIGVDEEPTTTCAQVQLHCIPQPTVDFMRSVNNQFNPELQRWANKWKDRLFLTGPPVTGPGVHDSVMGGFQVANNIMAHAWRQANPDWKAAIDKEVKSNAKQLQKFEMKLPPEHLQGVLEDMVGQHVVDFSSFDTSKLAVYENQSTLEDVLSIVSAGDRGLLRGPNCLWPVGVPQRYRTWKLDHDPYTVPENLPNKK